MCVKIYIYIIIYFNSGHELAQGRKCHACNTKCTSISPRATPATQSARRCRPSAPPEPVQCRKCHACHAECTSMSPRATPATQSGGRCRPSAPPEPAQCRKCHACHAECTSMSPRATPATQSGGRCRQVPRLPRKQPRRQRRPLGTKRATRASPVL